MTDKRALGMKIKQKREVLGMTAVQLAEQVGVTQRYIYKIEAGKSLPAWKATTHQPP